MSSQRLKGIDISHYQTSTFVDVVCEDANLDFLIAKATEGTNFFDPMFDEHMHTAQKYELLRGAYHYVHPRNGYLEKNNAVDEADFFVRMVRPYGDALLALDFEHPDMMTNAGVNYVAEMAERIKYLTGSVPLVYLSESFNLTLDMKPIVDIGCGLWVAKWGKNGGVHIERDADEFEFNMAEDGLFPFVAIQQISSRAYLEGRVSNKPFALDVDVANMSYTAWGKYANPRF